jgi:hypothetical protein
MSAICLSGVGQTNDKSYKDVICPVSGCPDASVICKYCFEVMKGF